MKRRFLAIFLLKEPKPEHARIIEVIREASGGDFKQAFLYGSGGSMIGFLFTSSLPPRKLDFSRILFGRDEALVIELADQFSALGLGVAASWLRSHRENPTTD